MIKIRKGSSVALLALSICIALPSMSWAAESDFSEPPFPTQIAPRSEKFIVVSPRIHAWGAYNADGTLVGYGIASAGANYCNDVKKPCRTKVGTFRIYAMGDERCYSSKFPLPDGGAPMPFCMYFNGNQALHGSPEKGVVRGNVSHGCVRMHASDAEWLRYNFVDPSSGYNGYRGTKVLILPY